MTLIFTEDSVLGDRTTRGLLTREGFFGTVTTKQELTVEGTVDPDHELTVTLALLR